MEAASIPDSALGIGSWPMWKRPHLRLACRLTSTRYIMENLEKERKKNLSDLTLSALLPKTPGMSICGTECCGFAPMLFFCQEKNVFPPVLAARKRTTSGTCQSGEEGQNPKTKLTGSLRQMALKSLLPKLCEAIRLQQYIKTLNF